MTPMGLRDEHVDGTRRALLAAARRRFGTLGFAGTSLDDVAAEAGVTKGALYHHFRNKEHLFVEVYDEIEAELSGRGIAAAVGATDAVDVLQRAFGAFLDLALDPEIQRINLLDAPSVLGVEQKLQIDAKHSLAGVRLAVEVGIADGSFASLDPDAVAQMLIAACSQAAVVIATSDDPTAARAPPSAPPSTTSSPASRPTA